MIAISSDWEALKECKPTLCPSIDYESRTERDERWLILRNVVSGEHIRLNASASDFLALVDGKTNFEQIFKLSAELGFSVEHVNSVVTALCTSGMMILGSVNEQNRLLNQNSNSSKLDRLSRFSNPLAIKIALHNPDKWLGILVKKTHKVLSPWLLIALLCLIAAAVVAGIANASVIASDFLRVASSPTHWWLLGLLYPLLKAIHELAHAVVIKRWGGSVHETGITFLVLMPVPYVDASDAWMFPQKYQRILVSAAGMLAECSLAAIGLFVFLAVQPGILKEIGFAVFVMGSLSTIVFNANPLLKFDGYYILQDVLDIPNLSSRATLYVRYLFKRYIYRVTAAESPVRAKGERRWLFSYGVLATSYRCVITVVIALFLASQFLILGVALACFAFFQLLVKPLIKLIRYLKTSPELDGVRGRTASLTLASALFLAIIIGLLPMPSSTRAEGVVWVPNQAQVFAAQDGTIDQLLVSPGDHVQAGELLFTLQAPALQTARTVAEAELDSTRAVFRSMQQTDRVKAQSVAADLKMLESTLLDFERRIRELDVVATNSGQFFIDENVVVVGRPVNKGDLLAYVVNKQDFVVKAVLPQQRVERLQAGVKHANVRLADSFSNKLSATVARQTPAASNTLPSPSLAYNGKGGIAVASHTDEQLKTLERVFHIELALPDQAQIVGIGGKAYVTLHHQPESLGRRWWRSTRQLLLKQLTV